MSSQIFNGLAVLSLANISSYIGYQTRNNTDNEILKEIGALAEVSGHLVSYVFYHDAAIDSIRHSIDGEIVARLNMHRLNPLAPGFVAVPVIGDKLLDDLSGSFIGSFFDQIPKIFQYFVPFIVGEAFSKAEGYKLFKIWHDVSHIPELLPAPHTVGLISAISHNLLSSNIEDWIENPGGDSIVGQFYQNYLLYAWEQIHIPHHFYEEIEAINNYYNDRKSPIAKEFKYFIKEFEWDL